MQFWDKWLYFIYFCGVQAGLSLFLMFSSGKEESPGNIERHTS
jgi:hypothetical protein